MWCIESRCEVVIVVIVLVWWHLQLHVFFQILLNEMHVMCSVEVSCCCCCCVGVEVVDSGRSECVLSHRSVERCTSVVCSVSSGSSGDGRSAPGVGRCGGRTVRERHDITVLRLRIRTPAAGHFTLRKGSKGQSTLTNTQTSELQSR